MSSDSMVTRHLRQAAEALEDQNPTGRTDMYGQVAALEIGLAALKEAIDGYGTRLKRDHPHGPEVRSAISPDLVNPHFKQMEEALENAMQGAAAFVAMYEDVNALSIRAAKNELANGGQKFLSQ